MAFAYYSQASLGITNGTLERSTSYMPILNCLQSYYHHSMDPLPSTDIIAPALFIGHGAPFYALKKNPFTPTWANFMKSVPSTAVTAIIVISAHWYEPGLAVTANERPETIHDFGGFEQALHEVQYPAKGSPSLCQKVAEILFPEKVEQSLDWGYDHGAWTILMHTHPKADIPVIQLRLDQTKTPAQLFELGRKLAPLRRQGVMLLGSGNVSHNLRQARFDMFGDTETAADWNKRFTTDVQKWILTKDWQSLQNCNKHPDFKMASPSPDHFLPILVIAGANEANDQVKVITEGYDAWSLSMNSYAFVPQYGKPETQVEVQHKPKVKFYHCFYNKSYNYSRWINKETPARLYPSLELDATSIGPKGVLQS